jgi:hypothetical protein
MPSSHRRVGLVLDDSMSSAFAVLREHLGPGVPEARLARTAVIDGAAFGAVLREATTARSASQEAAQRILREMRDLLATMTLPPQVKTIVIDEIDRVSRDSGVQERRQRQLALLDLPNPYGRAALDLTESIDAFDRRLG